MLTDEQLSWNVSYYFVAATMNMPRITKCSFVTPCFLQLRSCYFHCPLLPCTSIWIYEYYEYIYICTHTHTHIMCGVGIDEIAYYKLIKLFHLAYYLIKLKNYISRHHMQTRYRFLFVMGTIIFHIFSFHLLYSFCI